MKNKTNISVKDIRNVRITPYMEIGENHGYASGDILDANATVALVEKKIAEVVGGASSGIGSYEYRANLIVRLSDV